jgi:hypothetical protein
MRRPLNRNAGMTRRVLGSNRVPASGAPEYANIAGVAAAPHTEPRRRVSIAGADRLE